MSEKERELESKVSGSGKSQVVVFSVPSKAPISPTHAEGYQARAGYPASKYGPPRKLRHGGGRATWECKGPEACK